MAGRTVNVSRSLSQGQSGTHTFDRTQSPCCFVPRGDLISHLQQHGNRRIPRVGLQQVGRPIYYMIRESVRTEAAALGAFAGRLLS